MTELASSGGAAFQGTHASASSGAGPTPLGAALAHGIGHRSRREAAPARLGLRDLEELRALLQPRAVFRFGQLTEVSGLACDSRKVRAGDVFFAVPGVSQDGAAFAREAVERGAVAVVAADPLDVEVPLLMVGDVRIALADAAVAWFRQPSTSLDLVGITGTNGKTSTAHMVRHCIREDGRRSGLLGTVGYTIGGKAQPAKTTTPGPLELQALLRSMVDRTDSACVMEVSSHALSQQRVRGVDYDVATFLNLTHDHLDYHGSMESYLAAKARLFEMLQPGAVACLPLHDFAAQWIADRLRPGVEVVRFGRDDPEADVWAHSIRPGIDGTELTLVMPHGAVDLFLPLPGAFQVDNAIAAAATAWALGVSELTIAGALETVPAVPGRLEPVVVPRRMGDGRAAPRVFVDYAHTPDALDKACRALAEVCDGPLTVVFGCGGDRDRAKRPEMARAVARHADRVYLTSDNPRDEDPDAILDDAAEGLRGDRNSPRDATRPQECYRVSDRAEAIHRAVLDADPNGVVLIAGKGHETGQIVAGGEVKPFDDRAVAIDALGGPAFDPLSAANFEGGR